MIYAGRVLQSPCFFCFTDDKKREFERITEDFKEKRSFSAFKSGQQGLIRPDARRIALFRFFSKKLLHFTM